MGVVKAGGIATLLNGWWEAQEMEHAVLLAEPKLIIADPPRAKQSWSVAPDGDLAISGRAACRAGAR